MSDYSTTLYSISFSGASISSGLPFDLFSVKPSSLSRLEIHEINIGQRSTAPLGNQQLDITLLRNTGPGNGATLIPANLKGWSAAPTAGTSATGPSSNLASTTSAALIYADNTDISGSWFYRPKDCREITLDKSEQLTVRVSAPSSTVVMSGTMLIRELGLP